MAVLGGPDASAVYARRAAALAAAGVTFLYVRTPGLSDAQACAVLGRVVSAVAGTAARVLARGRADLALATGAAGVHLPSAGLAASTVRRVLPAGAVCGRSVHTLEEAAAAERDGGCDYLLFGTVYPSASKPAGHVAAGLDALAAVCRSVSLPVLAIGGMVPERFDDVAAAGAAGVAGIGLFAGGEETIADVMTAATRAWNAGRRRSAEQGL
jgi:thiamine-phosphate pyrophosphorylase